jgi:hypothetical protein
MFSFLKKNTGIVVLAILVVTFDAWEFLTPSGHSYQDWSWQQFWNLFVPETAIQSLAVFALAGLAGTIIGPAVILLAQWRIED